MTYHLLEEYKELLAKQGLLAAASLMKMEKQEIRYLTYNSKAACPGTLFICKGAAFKVDYLKEAIRRGAVAYVASQLYPLESSVPCLLVSAFCRLKGVRPFFACHGCVCVYFCAHLVKCYGIWSANPQFQDYVFSMLACACLALFAYQQTAMDTDMGEGMLQYTLGLLAGYLGIAALYGAQYPWLYLAGSIWALTNLTRPAVAPWYRRAKEDV
jgi:hypothetical protein